MQKDKLHALIRENERLKKMQLVGTILFSISSLCFIGYSIFSHETMVLMGVPMQVLASIGNYMGYKGTQETIEDLKKLQKLKTITPM